MNATTSSAGNERFGAALRLLEDAAATGEFPCAVAEVGRTVGMQWSAAVGRVETPAGTHEAEPDAIFDLASLTKVIATTTVIGRLVETTRLSLERRVSSLLDLWRGNDRAHVTVRDLLAHSSGLTAHLPFYRDSVGRAEFEAAICELPLEYSPRTRSVYSDLGFMLLGFIAEDIARRPLDVELAAVSALLGNVELTYRPPLAWLPRTAPTGHDKWRGRVLRGEVHDRNAWALGGVAGHAGVFGTAAAVGAFAREILAGMRGQSSRAGVLQADTIKDFTRRTDIPASSRALGWDTMLPTSSCGVLMSTSAVGHTGYTGTSLWIDPMHDVYVVLLTNRVHPTDKNDAILEFRPAFHDEVMRVYRTL